MAVSPRPSSAIACLILLLLESTAAKKYCWYVDAGYPTYFICRAYEDCCGTRCCMRTFSIQRLWYFWTLQATDFYPSTMAGWFFWQKMKGCRVPLSFWTKTLSEAESYYSAFKRQERFLLMMGVLFCCGAGFFIRRRLHPPQMTDDPPFTVGFTRQPVNTTGCQTTGNNQSGMQYYTEPGAPAVNPIASSFQIQPNFPLLNPAYPPPPAYCNQPPPPYEQVVKISNKEAER
ncbi:WW domain binding protein VOPP1 isoform X2 [Narcine bancroftii]|uniref:WW domain binding protein VOPP1 isoform X2 n=1 Tax=Narcine bancroftii TaxID=1343680 RepID=UPI003831CDC3